MHGQTTLRYFYSLESEIPPYEMRRDLVAGHQYSEEICFSIRMD